MLVKNFQVIFWLLFVIICINSPLFHLTFDFYLPPARRQEIIICTMCVRACVGHAVFSETTTVTHFW